MTNDTFSQDAEDTVREILDRTTRRIADLQDDSKRLRDFARARKGRISRELLREAEAVADAASTITIIVLNYEYRGHQLAVTRFLSAASGEVLYRYSIDGIGGVAFSNQGLALTSAQRRIEAMPAPEVKPSGSRESLIEDLRALLGDKFFIRESEEFDGRVGAIWTTNEETAEALEGGFIYDTESLACHPSVEAVLDKHQWFCEPYDAGTLFFYKVS
jgi:hypothetical protein